MITPVGYRVLVKPDKPDDMTKGGIVVPANARDRLQAAVQSGEVIGIGSHIEYCAEIKKGDKVVFAKYSGSWTDDTDGTKYIIVNDEDIQGIIE